MFFCNGATSVGALAVFLQAIVASAVQIRELWAPDLETPRMYVAEGCDGSTATIQHAVKILALHGIDAGRFDINREMAQTKRTPTQQNKYWRDRKQNWVFKSILHRDMKYTVSPDLKALGTKAVYVTRKNSLDQLVCMVRDCFLTNDKYGHPVDETGKRSHLCFDRRSSEDRGKGYKAKLQTTQVYHDGHTRSFLGENLNRLEEVVSSGYEELKKAGYTGPRIWYEDITAFEKGGAKNIDSSLEEWERLLKAWGVKADRAKVREYLVSESGTWSPSSQQAEIYNFEAVKEEMKRLGKEDMVRD